MSWLLIRGEDGAERAVPLTDATLRIGRAADSDVVLADAKKSVSRSHAEVRCEEGCYVIVDLESQNGTWVGGERVQRAELPVGGEIHVGTFRLELRDGDAPSGVVTTTTVSGAIPPPVSEVVISHPTAPRSHGRAAAAPAAAANVPAAPAARSNGPIAIAAIVGLAVIGGVAWKLMQPAAPQVTEAASSVPAPAPAPPVAPPVEAAVPTESVATPPDATATNGSATPSSASKRPTAPAAAAPASPRDDPNATAATRPARTTQPPVPRKPDETVEQWHNRIDALQARYEASKIALQRGDYASAASGFEAILRAEPGFGDVPELLVRARNGLRASAIDLLNAGKRLDASGDWMGAMQQFERARDVDASTPGIDAAIARVKEELREAGQQALERGLDQERQGHAAQALQEYNKAMQWLPADDPGLATARARAERLRISQ